MNLYKKTKWLLSVAIFISLVTPLVQAKEILKEGHPERYVVKKGDTLWDIASTFLNEPWRWKEIWKANKSIENPNIIFPGDVLVLAHIDGKPVLKSLKRETVYLKPSVRVEDITNAIPPISPRAIKPFYSVPLVTTLSEIESSAYIVNGANDRLVGGKGVEMFARGLKETSESKYHIFRAGREFIHPITGEKLGFEAIDIGNAKLVDPGDPAKVLITSSREGVEVNDRLKPVNNFEGLPFFFPSTHPDTNIKSIIFRSNRKTPEIGKLDIVTMAFGDREGVEPGQVFKVISGARSRKDFIANQGYVIPSEQIGLVMVLRVFEKVSYGIVTNASRQIETFDQVVHPKAN